MNTENQESNLQKEQIQKQDSQPRKSIVDIELEIPPRSKAQHRPVEF